MFSCLTEIADPNWDTNIGSVTVLVGTIFTDSDWIRTSHVITIPRHMHHDYIPLRVVEQKASHLCQFYPGQETVYLCWNQHKIPLLIVYRNK